MGHPQQQQQHVLLLLYPRTSQHKVQSVVRKDNFYNSDFILKLYIFSHFCVSYFPLMWAKGHISCIKLYENNIILLIFNTGTI